MAQAYSEDLLTKKLVNPMIKERTYHATLQDRKGENGLSPPQGDNPIHLNYTEASTFLGEKKWR